ncbi:hypothetical protein KPH14_007136 [Odynerus spinipes]|uniref:Uncharacterized protein n=1 Tax=Odynerus spinipes TaxID=1348599 RepID=A0AAD9VS63_9HYME|nr:hypothetical protein KPH14_007136 [Odynerus spinipes]
MDRRRETETRGYTYVETEEIAMMTKKTVWEKLEHTVFCIFMSRKRTRELLDVSSRTKAHKFLGKSSPTSPTPINWFARSREFFRDRFVLALPFSWLCGNNCQ